MDCSPPSSSVHEILQARILGWVAMPSSRGSSHSGAEPESLVSPVWTGRFFTISVTWASLKGLLRVTENPNQPSSTEKHNCLFHLSPGGFLVFVFCFFFKSYWCSMVKQENMKRNPGLCNQVELDGTPAQPLTNFGVLSELQSVHLCHGWVGTPNSNS